MSGSNHTFVFKIENEAILFQLHHKAKHNILNVLCEVCEEISAPYFDQEQKKWIVPNDIVGFDSKKPKNVKIRFHPSVAEMSLKNKSVHNAACSSSIKYMDCLLEDSEWTRKENDSNLIENQIDKMATLIMDMDLIVDFQSNIMTLTLIQDYCQYFDDLVKILMCKSISGHIYTNISDSEDCEILEINFEKDDCKKTIARVYIDSNFLTITEKAIPLNFEISERCIIFILSKVAGEVQLAPPNVPNRLSLSVFSQNREQDVPVYSPCYTMVNLTEKLSTSLAHQSTSPVQQGTLNKVAQNFIKDAIVALDKAESPALSQFVYNITSAPLVVNCDFVPIPISSSPISDPKWSPTDSIDSGVSLSPTRSIEDVYYSPMPRERSCSESAYNSRRLKGILKWPRSSMRFNRSYSECHEDGSISPVSMCYSPPFFEDEEDIFQEDDETPIEPPAPRKKSVSFSERIDRRLFNSKTSIEAQKKKTQKKNEKKRHREEVGANCRGEIDETGRVSMSQRRPTV